MSLLTADENTTNSQAESQLSLPRTAAHSLKSLTNDTLPPCYMNKRDSPKMTISHLTLVEYEDALSKPMLKYLLRCICRLHSSTASQHVSGWAGFISESGQVSSAFPQYIIIQSLITLQQTTPLYKSALEYQKMQRERSVRNTLSQHLT